MKQWRVCAERGCGNLAVYLQRNNIKNGLYIFISKIRCCHGLYFLKYETMYNTGTFKNLQLIVNTN